MDPESADALVAAFTQFDKDADAAVAVLWGESSTFNPACSKCRTVQGILAEQGVEAGYVRYLERAPTRAELEAVLRRLGTDDPRSIVRTGDGKITE